ncbi:MAG: 1,4-alpha-glucan branching protein GlgB [Nitrospinae bacterium]|nr:1,4-alpha-glucan branching protein GlgB [Nitrospinota bacterium]
MKARTNGPGKVRHDVSLLTDRDIYLFKEGTHGAMYDKLGSHVHRVEGEDGTCFAVWAPNAQHVSVIGDFNRWDADAHVLKQREDGSGIWEGFIPGVSRGALYKYHVRSRFNDYRVDKGDPYAFYWEVRPNTASRVWDLDYSWGDGDWMKDRARVNSLDAPMSVYEVHLGSWMRVPEDNNRCLTYTELAARLVEYVKEMGFTHVEFLPVMEHPFYGSWGYQKVGYFAPTSGHGTPREFMGLIDALHQNGIGVILDWVPSHFPNDAHGLAFFDGTYLYEHADPKKGFHPEWNTYIFNHGRYEVRSFLISSALFWLEKYHADGLRVDAVASMLYLDYARKDGEWVPNRYGGNEDLDAVEFLRLLNQGVYRERPGVQTIAEESTAWPMVSRPVHLGGLGFGMKWNMGWMHDTLDYFSKDPVFRKFHHERLTFGLWYAFTENFVLPFSHDEVVHGKGSLIGKMPGNDWEKFANLRLLLGYMYGHPGKKLLFMGGEFGQWNEWNHDASLDWHLLNHAPHRGIRKWVGDLNSFYKTQPALHEMDFSPEGFEWIDFHDWEQSVVSFVRKSRGGGDLILVACNLTPVPRLRYRMGTPRGGWWRECLNSDAVEYGGGGYGNFGGVDTAPIPAQGRDRSIEITLPPLGVVFFKNEGG